jgi:hypothetical protein
LETIAFVRWLQLCRRQRGKPLLSEKQHSICLICDPSRLNVFILLPPSIREGNAPLPRALPQQQRGITPDMTSFKFFLGGWFSFVQVGIGLKYGTCCYRLFKQRRTCSVAFHLLHFGLPFIRFHSRNSPFLPFFGGLHFISK